MKHREHLIKTYKAKGQLNGLGYMLDDVDDWDIVAELPIEIEEKILDLRSQGFGRVAIQNEEFNDFEEYGPIYRKFTYSIKEVLPSLKSLIDNFTKYCSNSPKQAIEYNFEELMALDEKITGNTYKSIKI